MAQFDTFDGLVVTVKTGFRDGKWWAQVEAEAAADAIPTEAKTEKAESPPGSEKHADIAKEAAAINKRTSGWLFAISQYDAKRLSSRLDEMIAPPSVEMKPPSVGPSAEPLSPENGTPLPPKPEVPEFPAPNPK